MSSKKFLLPLLVLLVAAVISAVLYFVRIEIHKDWQTTIGTITNVEIKHRRKFGKVGGGGWHIHYYWIYTVDGVEYSGYDYFGYRKNSNNKSIGDQKEIWYNPDNHSESSFYKPGPDLYPYAPFIFAIPIMLAVYHTQAKKENKRLRW